MVQGRVSIFSHSLGSVLMWDILCNQPRLYKQLQAKPLTGSSPAGPAEMAWQPDWSGQVGTALLHHTRQLSSSMPRRLACTRCKRALQADAKLYLGMAALREGQQRDPAPVYWARRSGLS